MRKKLISARQHRRRLSVWMIDQFVFVRRNNRTQEGERIKKTKIRLGCRGGGWKFRKFSLNILFHGSFCYFHWTRLESSLAVFFFVYITFCIFILCLNLCNVWFSTHFMFPLFIVFKYVQESTIFISVFSVVSYSRRQTE